jgi:hypothetical protein
MTDMPHRRAFLGAGILAIGALLALLVGSRIGLDWLPLSESVRLDTASGTATRVVTPAEDRYDLELTVRSSPQIECFLNIAPQEGGVRQCSQPPQRLYIWWQVRQGDTLILEGSTHSGYRGTTASSGRRGVLLGSWGGTAGHEYAVAFRVDSAVPASVRPYARLEVSLWGSGRSNQLFRKGLYTLGGTIGLLVATTWAVWGIAAWWRHRAV